MKDIPSFSELTERKIYKVSDLNAEIKTLIESGIGDDTILVEGEISNFRGNYASGHWYFSLKDEKNQISAVCFKWANQHIKFDPENGMEVICSGKVSVYEKQGTYSLNVRHIEPKGVGAQALALEKLKEKLFKEGLFDSGRKKPLPYLAQKIGVVTSPTGAAIRDLLKVIYRRSNNIEVIVSPARVQGKDAYKDIIEGLDRLYRIKDLDLIIVTRGGGSKEDLWVFNNEELARKIASSPIPIISAVGHEIDIPISDLVADIRAATPSIAAELAVKEKKELILDLKNLKNRMNRSLINCLNTVDMQLDQHVVNINRIISSKLESLEYKVKNYAGKLDSLSPLKVLSRGYSIAYNLENGELIKESDQINVGDKLGVKFHKGKAVCKVDDVEL